MLETKRCKACSQIWLSRIWMLFAERSSEGFLQDPMRLRQLPQWAGMVPSDFHSDLIVANPRSQAAFMKWHMHWHVVNMTPDG